MALRTTGQSSGSGGESPFPLFPVPDNNDSWLCSCILSSWENGISLKKLFTLVGRLFSFSTPKRKHVLKSAESHRCEVKTLGVLACILNTFYRFLKGVHFRKSLTESERSDHLSQENFTISSYGSVRHKDFCYYPIPEIGQILISNTRILKKQQRQLDVKGIKDRGLGTRIFVRSGYWNEVLI